MSCSIKQNIIDVMVDKELMSFNPQRNMYEATTDAYTFSEQAQRIQKELETEYGIKTDPVIFITETSRKSLRPGPYYRDNVIKGSLIRFRQSEIDRFQALSEVSPENRVAENNRLVSEAYEKLDSSMVSFLTQMGISVNVMNNITDSEGNKLDWLASAELANKAVVIAKGGNESELTEEVLHFYMNALKDLGSSLYKSVRGRITSMPEYAETAAQYASIENYSQEQIIDEAITKVILNRIGENGIKDRETRWWKRTWQDIKKTFNIGDPYLNAAYALFNEDLANYKKVVANTKSKDVFASAGAQRTRELTVAQLVDTHSKLKLDEEVIEDMIKGKLKRPELFFDEKGMIVRYRKTLDDGTTKVVAHRVTDTATINSFRNKDIADIKEIQNLPKSKASRDAGTSLHATGQYLMELFASKMEGVNLIDLLDEGKTPRKVRTRQEIFDESILTEEMFKVFESQVKALLTEMVKVQQDLNAKESKETGTVVNKAVDVMTEVRLYDPETDTAGTIDILFLFSDNTAGIYDYKFISPSTESSMVDIEEGLPKIVESPFHVKKLENFDSQISFYSKVLRIQYGVADVKRSRIVPAHIDFMWKDGAPAAVNTFNMGQENNVFLRHRVVADELTEYPLVNKKLSAIYGKIEVLKGKRGPKNVSERLFLEETAQELVMQGDFANVLQDINSIINTVNLNIAIDDENDPNYISFPELKHYQDVLAIFSDIEATTIKMRDKIGQSKDITTLNENLKSMSETVNNALVTIDTKLNATFLKEANSRTDYLGTVTGAVDNLKRMDIIDNPLYKEGKNIINLADRKTAKASESLRQKWLGLKNSLEDWADKTAGSRDATIAYGRLIKDTGKQLFLISMFKPEFRDKIKEVITDRENKTKSIAWMQERFQIKDGAKEAYLKMLKAKINILKKNTTNQKSFESQLERFKKSYNVFDNEYDDAWISPQYYRYLELKPKYAKTERSEEFEFINRVENKPLLEYYTAWKSQINEFESMLESHYDMRLSENMIPSMRAGLVEKIASGEASGEVIKDWFTKGWVVKTDEDDRSGGSGQQTVPLSGIQPLVDSKGEATSQLVSKDLTRAMYLFGSNVYNYVHKSEIESKILYMRAKLVSGEELAYSNKGVLGIKRTGAKNPVATSADTISKFDEFIDYFVYGNAFKGQDYQIFGISGKKVVSKLNQIFSIQAISLPVRIALAARLSGAIGTMVESAGGQHYTKKNLKDAAVLYLKDKGVYMAISNYLDLHAEEHTEHKERRLRTGFLNRWLDSSFMFEPLGLADRQIDRQVGIATLYNLGFNSKGEVKRLSQLPEGTPNIIESFKKSVKKDSEGRMAVDPKKLPKEFNTQIEVNLQQKIKRLTGRIKGAMGSDEIVLARRSIFGALIGKFKWFIPAIAEAHFGRVRFDAYLDSSTEGRIAGFFKSLKMPQTQIDEEIGFMKMGLYFFQGMGSAVSKLTMLDSYNISAQKRLELIAKGKWDADKDQKKYDERRQIIEKEFRHFQFMSEEHAIKEMDLEAYIEMRQASVKQSIAELQIVGLLLLLVSLLSMSGDDDEKYYRKSFASRKFMDILSRVLLETSFAINPMEFDKINRGSLIPALSVITGGYRILSSGIQELSEAAGINKENKQRTSFWLQLFKSLPMGRQFANLTELEGES